MNRALTFTLGDVGRNERVQYIRVFPGGASLILAQATNLLGTIDHTSDDQQITPHYNTGTYQWPQARQSCAGPVLHL